MWIYKCTNKKHWSGKTIYEAFLFDEYMGDRLRMTNSEIKKERSKYGPAGKNMGINRFYPAI